MADQAKAPPAAPPRKSGARDVAYRVLARVDHDRAFATRALSVELDRAGLGSADRGLATDLVYGVLRRRERLDRALLAHARRGLDATDPHARIALRMGAYQILFLDRIPAHAAVDDAVERCKTAGGPRLAGFANAILRKLACEGEPPLPEADRDPLGFVVEACGLPEWLGRLMVDELGGPEAALLAEALMAPAPLSLRVNTARATVDEVVARLAAERPQADIARSPLSATALLCRHLDGLSATAAQREGLVAVQDLGAQVVTELCGAAPGERILDVCAGVGGKTMHLATLAEGRATVEAVDVAPRKLAELDVTRRRLGVEGITTRVADLLAGGSGSAAAYDRVLLDAPCAGFGVLRRHPEALQRRGPADLAALAGTQKKMLAAAAALVRPGGLLVYAVCTFERAETVDVVDAFLASASGRAFTIEPPAGPLADLADERGFARTWPHRHDADAFFVARLRRQA